jgi:hypothetical protein
VMKKTIWNRMGLRAIGQASSEWHESGMLSRGHGCKPEGHSQHVTLLIVEWPMDFGWKKPWGLAHVRGLSQPWRATANKFEDRKSIEARGCGNSF